MNSTPKQKRQRSQIEAIRWSLARAASEFGFSPKTVATRVKQSGIIPGNDGLFSTVDIHAAICGDMEREKLRKVRVETQLLEMERSRNVGGLVDRHDFVRRLETVCVAMKQRIMGSTLSDVEKDALCSDLAELISNKGG